MADSSQHDFDFLDLRFQQCSARKRTKSLNTAVLIPREERDSCFSVSDDDEQIRSKSPLSVKWTNHGHIVRRASNPCNTITASKIDEKKQLSVPLLQIDEIALHRSLSSKALEDMLQSSDSNAPDFNDVFPLCLLESSTIELPEPLTKQALADALHDLPQGGRHALRTCLLEWVAGRLPERHLVEFVRSIAWQSRSLANIRPICGHHASSSSELLSPQEMLALMSGPAEVARPPVPAGAAGRRCSLPAAAPASHCGGGEDAGAPANQRDVLEMLRVVRLPALSETRLRLLRPLLRRRPAAAQFLPAEIRAAAADGCGEPAAAAAALDWSAAAAGLLAALGSVAALRSGGGSGGPGRAS